MKSLFKIYQDLSSEKNSYDLMSDKESKNERFYEPRNWDKFIRIDDEPEHEAISYCGKCGHVIYEGDRFCTKCGTKKREEKLD